MSLMRLRDLLLLRSFVVLLTALHGPVVGPSSVSFSAARGHFIDWLCGPIVNLSFRSSMSRPSAVDRTAGLFLFVPSVGLLHNPSYAPVSTGLSCLLALSLVEAMPLQAVGCGRPTPSWWRL
jgi:hypothetical protein